MALLVIFYPVSLLKAEIGCIDNSWHLAKAYDAKDYHLVQCNCQCSKHPQSADRGQCQKCKHFRDPRPYIIIQPSKSKKTGQSQDPKKDHRKKQLSWKTR